MKKNKVIASLLLTLMLVSTAVPVFAAVPESNNTTAQATIAPRTILFITKESWAPSNRISVYATLQVQDSTNQITGISNARIGSYLATGMSNMSVGSPTVWNNGSYATVTVTYGYKGKTYSEICKFTL